MTRRRCRCASRTGAESGPRPPAPPLTSPPRCGRASGWSRAVAASQWSSQEKFIVRYKHRLNMELDLQSLFGLNVRSCTHWLRPRIPPPAFRALLVTQDEQHLFVTPWTLGTTKQCYGSMTFWNGSGSGDPCLRLMDPPPAPLSSPPRCGRASGWSRAVAASQWSSQENL
jgi:hypothetical protein